MTPEREAQLREMFEESRGKREGFNPKYLIRNSFGSSARADARPVCKRIANGTAADWWWHRDDVPVGTELFTHPEASAPGLSDAYDEGFMEAANWADRDDLLADMDSPAYKECRTEFLTRASAETVAEPGADDINAALKLHGLPHNTPSQLADAFRLGAKWAAQSGQRAGVAEGFGLLAHERNLLLSIVMRLEAGNEKKAIYLEHGSARIIRELLDRAAAPTQQQEGGS